MPRLRRRQKQRSSIRLEDLTIDELLDLGSGYPWRPPINELGVLRTIEDVEDFFLQYRYRFHVCQGHPCDEDYDEIFCSKPGERPWIWWRFEAGYDEVPDDQVSELKALRALRPGEKRAAAKLTKKEKTWTKN